MLRKLMSLWIGSKSYLVCRNDYNPPFHAQPPRPRLNHHHTHLRYRCDETACIFRGDDCEEEGAAFLWTP